MKFRIILFSIAILLWKNQSIAAGTQYDLRIDGLACPFCAYGNELSEVKTHLQDLSILRNELTLLVNLCTGNEKGCPIIQVIMGVQLWSG